MQKLSLVTRVSIWLTLSLLGVILTGGQALAATTMALVASDTEVCIGDTFTINIEVSGMNDVVAA